MSYENFRRRWAVVRVLYAMYSPERKVTLALHDRLRRIRMEAASVGSAPFSQPQSAATKQVPRLTP